MAGLEKSGLASTPEIALEIMNACDADSDGTVTAAEFENAFMALKSKTALEKAEERASAAVAEEEEEASMTPLQRKVLTSHCHTAPSLAILRSSNTVSVTRGRCGGCLSGWMKTARAPWTWRS